MWSFVSLRLGSLLSNPAGTDISCEPVEDGGRPATLPQSFPWGQSGRLPPGYAETVRAQAGTCGPEQYSVDHAIRMRSPLNAEE